MLVGNAFTFSMNVRRGSIPLAPSRLRALNSGRSPVNTGVTSTTGRLSLPNAWIGSTAMIASSDAAFTASLIGSLTSARISYFTSRKRMSSPRCSQRTTRSPTGSPP